MGQEQIQQGGNTINIGNGTGSLRRFGGFTDTRTRHWFIFSANIGKLGLGRAMDEIDKMNNTYFLGILTLRTVYRDNDARHVPAAAPGAESVTRATAARAPLWR